MCKGLPQPKQGFMDVLFMVFPHTVGCLQGLWMSGQIAHPNQIWPTVRAWLPHVRIISPEHLQVELEQQLRGYLDAH